MNLLRHRGFTLIELLVVVAILGILMGLLLPGIKKALKGGTQVQCQSQLRQLYVAVTLYANDSAGFFPRIVNDVPEGNSGHMSFLGAYLDEPDPSIFKCTNPSSAAPEDSYYYYNDLFVTHFPTSPSILERTLGDPASKIFIYGCRFNKPPAFRPHGQGVNTLYADGHVDYERK
jgi:prepilin-type N-terminal cleavage/methylation domain-containing protein/prepilin-type processing-associated H-X9-DG protein